MNDVHKLVLLKENNIISFFSPKKSKSIPHLSDLERLSHQWHIKNNIQIKVFDITYNFTIYDYLTLSDKFQKASNLIIAEGATKHSLDFYIGLELSESEHKKITPYFFHRLLDIIDYDIVINQAQGLNKIFLFLKRLLKFMPHRFTTTAELTAEYFLSLEKNIDKKINLIKNRPRLGKHFSHYQNLLNSWNKLIDEDYIRQGYSEEDIDKDGSLSEYKMRKRTSTSN